MTSDTRPRVIVVGGGLAGLFESGKTQLSGIAAVVLWAFIHLTKLPQAQHRVEVLRRWAWAYFGGDRGSRLILAQPK